VKAELTAHTVLALYDPQADTKISADASSHGLGAVLLQKQKIGMATSGLCFQRLMLPDQCQRLDMPRLRKKLLPLLGHVRSSLPTFWESTSVLTLITNH